MHQHLEQANHNKNFHDCIETQFAGQFNFYRIILSLNRIQGKILIIKD